MRNLYFAVLLLAAVGTYADYLLHPSGPTLENTAEIGGSQSGDDVFVGVSGAAESASGSGSGMPFINVLN